MRSGPQSKHHRVKNEKSSGKHKARLGDLGRFWSKCWVQWIVQESRVMTHKSLSNALGGHLLPVSAVPASKSSLSGTKKAAELAKASTTRPSFSVEDTRSHSRWPAGNL